MTRKTVSRGTKRKIIQIACAAPPSYELAVLYALCDDGTVFWKNEGDVKWNPEPSIPQGDIETLRKEEEWPHE